MNFPFSSLSDAGGMRAAVALYSLNFAATGNTSSMSTCSCLCERIQGQADQWTLVFNQSKSELVCGADSACGRDVNPVLGLRPAAPVSGSRSASLPLSVRAGLDTPHMARGLNKCPLPGCAPRTGGPQGVNTCHSRVQWRDRQSRTAGISGC